MYALHQSFIGCLHSVFHVCIERQYDVLFHYLSMISSNASLLYSRFIPSIPGSIETNTRETITATQNNRRPNVTIFCFYLFHHCDNDIHTPSGTRLLGDNCMLNNMLSVVYCTSRCW